MIHCLVCEVQWSVSAGRRCWCCPLPGRPGLLPARLTSHNAYQRWKQQQEAAA